MNKSQLMNTNLRLSALHFEISSGVSSLILLAPGACVWQRAYKNTDISKESTNSLRCTVGCITYIFPVEADYFFMSHEVAVGHRTLGELMIDVSNLR